MKKGREQCAGAAAGTPPSGDKITGGGKKTGLGKKLLKLAAVAVTAVVLLLGAATLGGYIWFTKWADGAEFDAALLPTATALPVVLDINGEKLPYAADNYVDPSSVPEHVKAAFVALEDKRFYSHKGYDPKGIIRAVLRNIKAGKAVEGASTITQQLVKNTHLSAERTLSRKLKEIAIAMKIEENYSKDEILAMYLSVIYFGAGAYGINEASRIYFGCEPCDLTVAQAATLAGILKNPSRYSPKNSVGRATERRNLVLDVMCREGYITEAERDEAKAEKMRLAKEGEKGKNYAEQYVAAAVREACGMLGITEYRLGNSGLVIMTAFDPEKQKILAEETLDRSNYSDGGVNGSAVLLDNATGEIAAYFGTLGYEISRQAGSVLKPLAVYAPALDAGAVTLATPVRDEKTDFGGYSPDNFDGVYYGDTTPREAIKRSMNTAAVKVLSYVGTDTALGYLRKLGVKVSEKDSNLALALGATAEGTNPRILAGAYSALARGGNYVKPHFVRAIVKDGVKTASPDVHAERVFSPETAALVTDCLEDTAKSGTARTLSSLGIAVAGKTGTVQRDGEYNTDAWSVSYTSEYTLAVWHGAEKTTELGGGHPTRHAAEVWRRIYAGEKPPSFELPRGVVRENVDVYSTFKNKKATLASPSTPKEYVRSELFAAKFRADECGSRFDAPVPVFSLAADGGTVTVTLTAEPAFDYTVLCSDMLGTRIAGTVSGQTGEFVPSSAGVRLERRRTFPSGSGGYGGGSGNPRLGAPDETDGGTDGSDSDGGELYPDKTVTFTHIPFSFGGKVTYTVQMSVADGDGAVIGALSKDCFVSQPRDRIL